MPPVAAAAHCAHEYQKMIEQCRDGINYYLLGKSLQWREKIDDFPGYRAIALESNGNDKILWF